MRIPGTLLAGIALSLPFTSTACNKSDENPEAAKTQEVKLSDTKPVDVNLKKTIDEKRKALEKKEREFASELGAWSSCELPNILTHLYMVSDSKDEVLKARDIAFKIVKRHQDFIDLTGNDFSIKKPNEEQLEAFNRVISMAQKGANIVLLLPVNNMTSHGIAKKIEGYLKKINPELKGEKLKEEVEHHLEYFTDYQKTFKKLQGQYMDLNVEVRQFNEEAKKASEPSHEPVWGLSSRRLAELLETFALRRVGGK